jgi:hypothetical protein
MTSKTARRQAREISGGIMKGCIDFAGSEIDDREYDRWVDTLTEASVRADILQTAVTEVRYLCESGGASIEQILKVLNRLDV